VTVVGTVELIFLALTSTPSMWPSSAEEARPVSVTGSLDWAWSGGILEGETTTVAKTTGMKSKDFDRIEPPYVVQFLDMNGPLRRSLSRRDLIVYGLLIRLRSPKPSLQ